MKEQEESNTTTTVKKRGDAEKENKVATATSLIKGKAADSSGQQVQAVFAEFRKSRKSNVK